MGGRIEVSSIKGAGSTFRFFVRADLPLPEPDSETSTPPSLSRNPSAALEKLHVLVVEDNIVNQKVLRRQLVKAGYTCEGESEERRSLSLGRTTTRGRDVDLAPVSCFYQSPTTVRRLLM